MNLMSITFVVHCDWAPHLEGCRLLRAALLCLSLAFVRAILSSCASSLKSTSCCSDVGTRAAPPDSFLVQLWLLLCATTPTTLSGSPLSIFKLPPISLFWLVLSASSLPRCCISLSLGATSSHSLWGWNQAGSGPAASSAASSPLASLWQWLCRLCSPSVDWGTERAVLDEDRSLPLNVTSFLFSLSGSLHAVCFFLGLLSFSSS